MTDKPGLFRRMLEAMIENRRRQAQRHVERYLRELGLHDPRKD